MLGAISPGPGPISPTWNPSTRGLRLVLSHTARDPDPPVWRPRGHIHVVTSNPRTTEAQSNSRRGFMAHHTAGMLRLIVHRASSGTRTLVHKVKITESNQRQRAIRTFTPTSKSKIQVRRSSYKWQVHLQLRTSYGVQSPIKDPKPHLPANPLASLALRMCQCTDPCYIY